MVAQRDRVGKPILAEKPLPPEPTPARPRLVLDTNVVLDWLLFDEPAGGALGRAIVSGRVLWLASAAMRGELQHVLARGVGGAWQPDIPAIFAAWDRWASPVVASDRPGPRSLRCGDADDQKFIDLAIETGAASLLSRDRAVLKLARSARKFGLQILTVDMWARQRAATP